MSKTLKEICKRTRINDRYFKGISGLKDWNNPSETERYEIFHLCGNVYIKMPEVKVFWHFLSSDTNCKLFNKKSSKLFMKSLNIKHDIILNTSARTQAKNKRSKDGVQRERGHKRKIVKRRIIEE